MQKISQIILALVVIICVAWLFRVYYLINGDGFLMLYGARAVLDYGVAHMDFNNLLRSGYLLNVPFMAMGLSFYGLRVLYLISLLLLAWLLAKAFCDKKNQKRDVAAIALLLFAFNSIYTRFLFNYLDVSGLGLMTCLGFYALSRSCSNAEDSHFRGNDKLFLAAIFAVIAFFGNLALAPMVCLGLIAIGLAYPIGKKTYLFWFLSFLCIALASYVYFLDWGAYQRLTQDGIFKVWRFKSSDMRAMQFFNSVLWCLIFVLAAAGAWLLVKAAAVSKKYPSQLYLALWLFGALAAVASSIWMRFTGYSPLWTMVTPLCGGLCCYATWHLVPPTQRRWVFWLQLVFVGLMCSHKFSSHMIGIGNNYFALMLLVQGLYFRSNKVFHTVAILYAVLTLFNNIVLPWKNHYGPVYGMWVNRVDPGLGVKVDPIGAKTYERFKAVYAQNNCQNKTFLVFEDFPSLYWLVHRRALFDNALISRFIVVPLNKQTLGVNIIKTLQAKGQWCVAYLSGSGVTQYEKPFGRDKVHPYLKSNATNALPIGRFPYRGNNLLTLYVR